MRIHDLLVRFFTTLLTAASSLLYSCLGESGDCPFDTLCDVDFSFSYTLNPENRDLFDTEVEYLTLYIYDEHGELVVTQERDVKEIVSEGGMAVRLPAGRYTVVAWGNTHLDSYGLENHGALEEINIFVASADENGNVRDLLPGNLFHSSLFIDLREDGSYELSLMRNTKIFHISVSGLENIIYEGDQPVRSIENLAETVSLAIISGNGRYTYDNSPSGAQELSYYGSLQQEQRYLGVTVTTMRLMENDSASRIEIKFDDGNNVIFSGSLMNLLRENLDNYSQAFLDKNHDYYMRLSFDTTGETEIKFIDWDEFYNSSIL